MEWLGLVLTPFWLVAMWCWAKATHYGTMALVYYASVEALKYTKDTVPREHLMSVIAHDQHMMRILQDGIEATTVLGLPAVRLGRVFRLGRRAA